jgi:hypothetical protein
MVPQFSEDASARIAKARAAADRRYHKNKRELPPLSVPDWDEAVRDLCAYYTLDICIAEVKEFTASSYPLHEIQAFLDHRVEELTQEVIHSPKWPAEGHLDKRMHRLIREVNLRRQIDFIKSSSQWKRWQSRVFGTRKSALAAALKPQAEVVTRVAGGFPKANQAGATEPNEDESTRAEAGRAATSTDGNGADRRAAIDAFILKCKQGTSMRATRTHIWRAAGHSTPRQFQFWQASDPKATAQDDQNFRRILAMSPTDFETLLKKKGII